MLHARGGNIDAAIASGEVSAFEVVRADLDQIDRLVWLARKYPVTLKEVGIARGLSLSVGRGG